MSNIALEVKGLTKKFGGLAAVSQFDLEVRKDEIVGLIGPNGAGKTTAFNLITGFDSPDKGMINFMGDSIVGLQPFEICRRGMARTFQQTKPMLGMTLLDNVVVGALNKLNTLKAALSYSKEILNFLDLTEYEDQLVDNLPVGYRKMLEMARCLATQPTLLLLDEVMAGLNTSEMILGLDKIKAIRSKGITILLIEHVMEAVMSISDRIIVLNYGKKIAEGSPSEVAKDSEVIEAYLGEDFALD